MDKIFIPKKINRIFEKLDVNINDMGLNDAESCTDANTDAGIKKSVRIQCCSETIHVAFKTETGQKLTVLADAH